MQEPHPLLAFARETLEIELTEAQRLLARLDGQFVRACELLLDCTGKAVVSGIGKSGHIGKKIAASLASTGTPAFFVHPAEALHGDLGMIGRGDVMIFISYSGRAKELDLILPLLAENGTPVIAITGGLASPLAQQADLVLPLMVRENDYIFKPSTSRYAMLAMVDVLATELAMANKSQAKDRLRRIKLALDSHRGGADRQPLGG